QYPDQHRVGVDEDVGLSADRPTLAEILAARGVRSAGFIGNPVARGFNLDRGFDEFHSVYKQKVNLGEVTHAEAFREVLPGFFSRPPAGRFFAYVHYLEPHFPYDPPPPFNTMFGPDTPLTMDQRRQHEWCWPVNEGGVRATREEIDHLVRLYDGGLAYVDREVGFLRRTLEQAAHVPLIVHYPAGQGSPGSRVQEVVSLLDLAPTIADALRVGIPDGTFGGRSLLRGAPGSRVVTRNTDLVPT